MICQTTSWLYNRSVKRDAESTRQRILEAATAEFAQYGIAGARIDRIAEAASSNKSMIYTYFESKDGLFEAVFNALMEQHMDQVPLDVNDLPEYAARVYDQNQKHPELFRMISWDWLERGAVGTFAQVVVESMSAKMEQISRAQLEGVIDNHFSPEVLLDLILALTRPRPDVAPDKRTHKQRRAAIKDAVQSLLQQ